MCYRRRWRISFQSIVNPSGNSTLRVHFNDKRMQMVRDKLLDMGCKVEISNLSSFVSINVPQEVSLKVVEDVLTNMQKNVIVWLMNMVLSDKI